MTSGSDPLIGLVGDVGGTHARFALADFLSPQPRLVTPMSMSCRDFARPELAINAYMDGLNLARRPDFAVIAVAGPIKDGASELTNLPWQLSETLLSRSCGFTIARLINDYTALARAAPILAPDETHPIGPDLPGAAMGTIAVLGPGTGFGVGGLIRHERADAVITTESGHMGFAPTDELEIELWRVLLGWFGRVSVERILSGPGLCNLYRALCEIENVIPGCAKPADITAAAAIGDRIASLAVDRFCSILGTVAGDIALGMNALGGVYIAGGIVPRLLPTLEGSAFRNRFEAKGRFQGYMKAIPTRAITHPYAALLGAADWWKSRWT